MQFELHSLIAQTYLQKLGFYTGALDGRWGPLSMEAGEKWDQAELDKVIPRPLPGTGTLTPYSYARQHLGTREIPGKNDNPLILRWLRLLATSITGDETPWCSAFVDAMAREAGYERSGKLNARSWLGVGESIPARLARPGDIAIFWRGERTGWEGHVAFIESFPVGSSSIRVLGGNQSDSVSIASYAAASLLGIRRLRPLDAIQGNTATPL